jgi:hypothetical protein
VVEDIGVVVVGYTDSAAHYERLETVAERFQHAGSVAECQRYVGSVVGCWQYADPAVAGLHRTESVADKAEAEDCQYVDAVGVEDWRHIDAVEADASLSGFAFDLVEQMEHLLGVLSRPADSLAIPVHIDL